MCPASVAAQACVGVDAGCSAHAGGPNGDLWSRLSACPPFVLWVPAHGRTGGGHRTDDLAFDRMADEAVQAAAFALRVRATARAERARDLRLLRVVHDVYAAVEVAALAAKRGEPQRLLWRRRYPRTGQFVRLLGAGTLAPGPGRAHPAVHDLRPLSGP